MIKTIYLQDKNYNWVKFEYENLTDFIKSIDKKLFNQKIGNLAKIGNRLKSVTWLKSVTGLKSVNRLKL